MKSRFHDAADAELTAAVDYYEGIARGLGRRFLVEIRAATTYIERYPEIAPVIADGVRAKVLVRFPYTIMYVVGRDELFIVSIAHQSKEPAFWADRIKPV
ncbi:MAG TPA: type II toxin-antitoxin system RelE/ParE family toxin [Thermoanaerobaculia bacterium]|jgi:plasmid stabilization system protein ParE